MKVSKVSLVQSCPLQRPLPEASGYMGSVAKKGGKVEHLGAPKKQNHPKGLLPYKVPPACLVPPCAGSAHSAVGTIEPASEEAETGEGARD